ncbi:hypothetical protein HY968_03055 [Candidatus Kaiserbacteria bacterium]|nr:hypothetical protein [Candidatus Kaiserbacteria bacterium]
MGKKPKLIVFASGSKDGGGSGFENLVNAAKSGVLDAEIVAVVSNHENGGVRARAEKLGVPFIYFPGPYDAAGYSSVLQKTAPKNGEAISGLTPWPQSGFTGWVALSGWLKKVAGLDPKKTFNIHPALLSFDHGRFGGPGLYGHHVHDAVKAVLDAGELTESGVSMHFVTDEYDRGPVFFEYSVPLQKGMTADEIAKAVNIVEHEWQPKITNMVVQGEISWDGKDPKSLVVPVNYGYLPEK